MGGDVLRPIDVWSIPQLYWSGRDHFVDQHADSRRHFDQRLARPRVAGYDDASVRRVHAVAERLHLAVLDPERSYADASAIVDDARRDLARIDTITAGNAVIGLAFLDVDGERLIEMLEHRLRTRGPVDRERLVATENPRCEHELSDPETVIAMQVRQKKRFDAVDREMRRRQPALDAATGVKKKNAS